MKRAIMAFVLYYAVLLVIEVTILWSRIYLFYSYDTEIGSRFQNFRYHIKPTPVFAAYLAGGYLLASMLLLKKLKMVKLTSLVLAAIIAALLSIPLYHYDPIYRVALRIFMGNELGYIAALLAVGFIMSFLAILVSLLVQSKRGAT